MTRFAKKKVEEQKKDELISAYTAGFSMPESVVFKAEKGLSENIIKKISEIKNEPEWMRLKRLDGYKIFLEKEMPKWGGDLSKINFDDIYYYLKPQTGESKTWEEVDPKIKETYDRLGVPEAEKKHLAGVKAQYESEVIYGSLKNELQEKGVLFMGMDEALVKYPEMVKSYFGKLIPSSDNKFAALNTATWSGGSFVYIPKGVKIEQPLQAYFRINAANMGQFERTLIIVDEGAYVHYTEGCFLAGSRVGVMDGFEKNIEDVEVGDMVMSHRGRPCKVSNKMKRKYNGKIYEIKLWGDSSASIKVTDEHPFLAVKRQKKEYKNTDSRIEWRQAEFIKKDDYLVYPKRQRKELVNQLVDKFLYKGNEVEYIVKVDEDFARLVGYFLAEGHVENEHYLTFTFHIDEKKEIKDVVNILEKVAGKKPILNKIRNHGQMIVLCDTKLARFFARKFGSSIVDKRIPDIFLDSGDKVLENIIVGMWRGDGSFDKTAKMFRYNTVSRNLAYRFRDILLSLGIVSSINLNKRIYPRKDIYTVIVSRLCNEIFGKMVDVKAEDGTKEGSMIHADDKYIYMPIKSIKITKETTEVYNLSVEDDESYVCEGVVSHNCTAPVYTTDSLHSAVVEIFVKKGGRCRYTTIQNWSINVYNLVTKRAFVEEDGVMEWVDGNLGSQLTMKYPSVVLAGKRAHGEILSLALASSGQHQDSGGKCIHLASDTTSRIISKSISLNGGKASYRGLIEIKPQAKNCVSKVVCDALLMDDKSISDTYPTNKIDGEGARFEHEATVSKIAAEQLFYLMSRGLEEHEAEAMIVNGFVEPIVKELPMEYAVELNRLISMQMEGSVG